MHILFLLGALLQGAEQENVISSSGDVTLTVSGGIEFAYVYRDSAVPRTRNALNGTTNPNDSVTFISGRASLRLEFTVGEGVSGALELANRKIDSGMNLRVGESWMSPIVREAWIDVHPAFAESLSLRAGVQPFRLTNRYGDEAFFLDLSEAESSWLGLGPSGMTVTADRDELEPVGLRIIWDAAIFLKVQFFAFTLVEGGRASDDETLFGVYASLKPEDYLTIKAILTLFTGPAKESEVWTLGAGVVWAPGEDWLLAVEFYGQFGDAAAGLDKQAFAGNISLRFAQDRWFIEAGISYASGDDPGDSDDEGWQSYENINRFIIVQSAEFGLDWDTNYALIRLAFEWYPAERWTIRFDVGWFAVPEEIAGVTTDDEDLGFEIDVTVSLALNSQTSVYGRVGGLFGSDMLDVITTDDNTWIGVIGLDFRF